MTTHRVNLISGSPLRPLDWRWQRATQLVRDRRHFAPRRDDVQIGVAMRYLRAWNKTPPEKRHAILARTFPELHRSHELHEQGGNLRAEVQARLLARQSPEDIAARLDLPVGVLRYHEALFFDVVDRLKHPDWVVLRAIGWWSFDGAKGRDSETLLRGYAYWGGGPLLEASLPYLLGDQLQKPPAQNENTPEGRLDRSIRLAIMVDRLPWTMKTDRILPRLGLLLQEMGVKPPVQGQNSRRTTQFDTELLTEKLLAARQQVPSRDIVVPNEGEKRQTA